MADLRAVEQRIAELKAQIEPITREIQVLENTARVLRALDRKEPVVPKTRRDFSELTMPEAAKQILLETAPKSLHYREITGLAIARGFKGRRTNLNAPREVIAASFRRMMGQDRRTFQQVGDGHYKIADEYLDKEEKQSAGVC